MNGWADRYSREDEMKELFLIAALSLPLANFTHSKDEGGYNNPETRDAFLREYEWIMNLLISSYPGHEFLFIWQKYHQEHPAEGWIEVPFRWRGHLIYRRPLTDA